MQQSRELCLLRIPIGVYGREVLPLLREIIERENCGHGADWNTGSAVNALHRADVKLGLAFEGRLIFARMDTVDRAHIHARGVFRSDAGLSNHVGHLALLERFRRFNRLTDDWGSATKELRYNTKPFEAQVARNRPARGAGCLDFGASGCLHSLVLRTKNRRRKARRASAEKSGAECAKEMRATTHAIKKPMESAEGKVIIVGVTGASGAVLAQTTLRMLDADPRVARIHLVVTETGIRLLEHELHLSGPFAELPDRILDSSGAKSQRKIEILPNTDVGASIASGSYAADSMCVIPCSMGTLAAIAGGASNDLVSRAADVTLKEGRRLVLCVRDTPFNRIHLENMLRAQQAGAVIMPAIPSFYHHPQTIDDLLTQYCCRVLVQLGLPQNRQFAWKGQPLRKAFKI